MTGPDSPSQTADGIEPLMSLDKVAQVLGISESSVYRLVRGGDLPRVKVGNRTLFEQADVRTFIASRREAAADNDQGSRAGSPSAEVADA